MRDRNGYIADEYNDERLATGRKRSRGHADVLTISEQQNGHFAKIRKRKKKIE